jgi:hypothetical protein
MRVFVTGASWAYRLSRRPRAHRRRPPGHRPGPVRRVRRGRRRAGAPPCSAVTLPTSAGCRPRPRVPTASSISRSTTAGCAPASGPPRSLTTSRSCTPSGSPGGHRQAPGRHVRHARRGRSGPPGHRAGRGPPRRPDRRGERRARLRGARRAVLGGPAAADHAQHAGPDRLRPLPDRHGPEGRRGRYPGDGANRWPAGHTLDAAHLYRLALESAPAGTRWHGSRRRRPPGT